MSVEPFSPMLLLKAGRRAQYETFIIDDAVSLAIKACGGTICPIYVNKKYDGARLQVHRKDNEVKVYTEGLIDVTDRVPGVVKEALTLNGNSFIIDCESEMWLSGVHQGREQTSGYLNGDTQGDDSNIILNVFDMMYYNGQILTDQPLESRIKLLKELGIKQSTIEIPNPQESHFNFAPYFLVVGEPELRDAITTVTKSAFSEGAMLKVADSKYELDGITNSWVKYKSMTELHVLIWKKIPTKTQGVFSYQVAVSIDKGITPYKADVVEIEDKSGEYLNVGKILNSDKDYPIGTLITVVIHTLFKYELPNNETTLRVYEARIYEQRTDESPTPDSINTAIEIATNAKILDTKTTLSEKRAQSPHDIRLMPFKLASIIIDENESLESQRVSEFTKLCDLFDIPYGYLSRKGLMLSRYDGYVNLSSAINTNKIDKIVVYADYEHEMLSSLSKHLFDVEVTDNLSDLIEQFSFQEEKLSIDSPIIDETKTFRFVLQVHWRGKSAHWDLRGEIDGYLQGYTLLVEQPGTQSTPVDTLEEAKKVDPTTTWKFNNEPGQKIQSVKKTPQPKEWLTIQGVIPPGGIGATSEGPGVFDIIDSGQIEWGMQKPYYQEMWLYGNKLSGHFAYVTIPNPYRQMPPTISFFQKLKDETPYVFGPRAVQNNYIPPEGVSALPKEMREKIPLRYRYWTNSDESKRVQIRNELVKALHSGEVKLHEELTDEKTVEFILQHHWWKEVTVIRMGPSHEHYDLIVGNKSFITESNPIDGKTAILERTDLSDDFKQVFKEPIPLKPKTKENPTAATDAWLQTIDNGRVVVVEDSELIKKFKFEGSQLNGLLELQRTSSASVGNLLPVSQLTLSSKTDCNVSMRMGIKGVKQVGNGWEISGIALTHGVWNGLHYSSNVVLKNPKMMLDAKLDTEHNRESIGNIKNITVKGDEIHIVAYTENPIAVQGISHGLYNGFSVDALVSADPVRKEIAEIKKYEFVSLVKYPACALCVLGE